MHPGSGCYSGTLANALLYKYPELESLPRSGIVHRLDKDTSGILVVARNDEFRNHFINEMQARNISKNYIAISSGSTLGSFEITDPIGRDKNNRTKMAIRDDGKEAITFVKLKEKIQGYSVLNISIQTGRTHQIRVHLASKKLPIIGDNTYNPRKIISKDTSDNLIEIIRNFSRQALHASSIAFKDMKSENVITYKSDIPLDMQILISKLKKL
jgi:23S rRNA pseudouridine1911/1915/1917 synthase